MKKVVSLFSVLLAAVSGVSAQTFTVANGDGVEIKYTVTTDSTVKVVSNNYTGRIVVPQTVAYQGTTYEVDEVGFAAFQNRSGVTFVQLPPTVARIGNIAFNRCTSLDTLVLLSPEPPISQYGEEYNPAVFSGLFGSTGNTLIENITICVPSGHLAEYRRSAWATIKHLTSPSALPITLYCIPEMEVYTDWYTISKIKNDSASYHTFFYEVGDTMRVKVGLEGYISTYTFSMSADSVFLGWDNGSLTEFVVSHADTLRPILADMGRKTLAVNQISTPVKVLGQLGYKCRHPQYHFPADSNTSPLYANGLWVSARQIDDADTVLACVHSFSAGDYVPGPLRVDGSCRNDLQTRRSFNRVWSVSRSEIDNFLDRVGTSGYSIPENILSWPGNGAEGYAAQLAPYFDADSDGVYNPRNGDYPLIRGDRMLFSIFSDATTHISSGSEPMGLEIHVSAYAFDEPADTALSNTVFLSYKIINRSSHTYGDVHFGEFVDFDLGYSFDDYVGCDVRRGMAYGYNGTEVDGPSERAYPGVPPAQGCTVLAGPTMDADGIDNPRIDIDKMRLHFPEQLATYASGNGYDTVRLNADANLYYPSAWHCVPDDEAGNNAINGANFGNGIADDERIGMRRFVYFNIGISSNVNSDPQTASDYDNLLHGRWKNGQSMKYGGDAVSTGTSDDDCTFMFPHDSDPLHWGTNGTVPSVSADKWSEIVSGNTPGDRRGLVSSGPFTMEPGETNTLDLAFTSAQSEVNYWHSVSILMALTDEVRAQFVRDTTDSGRPFTYRPIREPNTGIGSTPDLPSLEVYPNPSHGRLTVALGDGQAADIDIYDIRGYQALHIPAASGQVGIDISGLPNGIYILHCGNKNIKVVKK